MVYYLLLLWIFILLNVKIKKIVEFLSYNPFSNSVFLKNIRLIMSFHMIFSVQVDVELCIA